MSTFTDTLAMLRAETRKLQGSVHRLRLMYPNETELAAVFGLLSKIDKLQTRRLKLEIDHATRDLELRRNVPGHHQPHEYRATEPGGGEAGADGEREP
jgi:hypothetical protein